MTLYTTPILELQLHYCTVILVLAIQPYYSKSYDHEQTQGKTERNYPIMPCAVFVLRPHFNQTYNLQQQIKSRSWYL